MSTTTAVNEKPILFSTEMVRAILEGRKTQTRRVIKPQPIEVVQEKLPDWNEDLHVVPVQHTVSGHTIHHFCTGPDFKDGDYTYAPRCPYGKPGDELWVRETFALFSHLDSKAPSEVDTYIVKYRADSDIVDPVNKKASVRHLVNDSDLGKWRPSIHMPRWASRIQLLVTDVRVERLQEMDNTDIMEEGVKPLDTPEHEDPWVDFENKYVDAFKQLWNSINADRGYSWESNPWVWGVDFEIKEVSQ